MTKLFRVYRKVVEIYEIEAINSVKAQKKFLKLIANCSIEPGEISGTDEIEVEEITVWIIKIP